MRRFATKSSLLSRIANRVVSHRDTPSVVDVNLIDAKAVQEVFTENVSDVISQIQFYDVRFEYHSSGPSDFIEISVDVVSPR